MALSFFYAITSLAVDTEISAIEIVKLSNRVQKLELALKKMKAAKEAK